METTMIERTAEDHAQFHSDMERIAASLGDVYEVYHRSAPTFLDNPDAVLAAFPEGFVHVADVKTDHVGLVFQLTNSIERGWWENPEVTLGGAQVSLGGARSTSVGDVIVKALAVGADANGHPIWKRWSVQMIGLREF